jgi:ElaB/YqjD/DUF883 family membrane-anchored ribosome-binding protein
MAYDSIDRTSAATARKITDASAATARRITDAAQDAAGRAGSYVQRQVDVASDRAQDLARLANARVQAYTGRAADAWVSDAQGYVRSHPLQMLGVMVGIGYVVGKLMFRASSEA